VNAALSGTELLEPDNLANPYPLYRRLRKEAPVWHVPGTDVHVVTSYALLQEAARRTDDFSSNMWHLLYRDNLGLPARLSVDAIGHVLATADPPDHGVHKRTVFPEFVAKRMSLLATEIAEISASCVDCAIAQGTADFMAEVANVVPISIVSRLIGFRHSNLEALKQAAFDATSVVGGTLTLPELLQLVGRTNEITAWIADQITQSDYTPDNDILTSIRNGIAEDVLTVAEGTGILQILLAAGGESTASLLGSAVRILAEDDELQRHLRAQPDLVPGFIEEVLRLESPFRSMLRSVPRDTSLGGATIPQNSTVLMFWAAGNRDPAIFENPDDLIIERPKRHVAFGFGIHQCVGAALARLESAIVIRTLLKRTRKFTLLDNDLPGWVVSLQVRRYERLPLQILAI
jgi:cytochrome P450